MKVDVIIPTKSVEEWPAKESIPHNQKTAGKHDIRLIPIESSGPSFSFSRSINLGLEQRREDAYAFLLNDDCFMDYGWIGAFDAAIKGHPESGIFGALLRFPEGHHGNFLSGRASVTHYKANYQHAGGYFPTTTREVIRGMVRFAVWGMAPLWLMRQFTTGTGIRIGFRFPGHHHRIIPRQRIHLITAAAMMLTPQCIDRLGFFDERYPIAFQDTAYCLRGLEAGMEPCLVSQALGTHYEGISTRPLEDGKRKDFQTLCDDWPIPRLRQVIGDKIGIVHPLYCGCGWWVE